MIPKVELFALVCDHFEQLLRFTHLFPLIFLIKEEGLSQLFWLTPACTAVDRQICVLDSSPPTRALQASFLPTFSAQSLLTSTSKEADTVNVSVLLSGFGRKGPSACPRPSPLPTHFGFSLFLVPSFPSAFKHIQNLPYPGSGEGGGKQKHTGFACP